MVITESLTSIKEQLSKIVVNHPRLVILGIGENRMGDDGAGPLVSFALYKQFHMPLVKIINGGIAPEHYLSEIIAFNPNILLLIDAITMDHPPGSVHFLNDSVMRNYLPISSHTLPLPVFLDRCKVNIDGLHVYLLGIVPYALDFLDHYELYHEDQFGLDEKEADPNIPFYAFNISPQMIHICENLVKMLGEVLQSYLS
jgi:hydrogenase 3 maturation protease